MTSPTTSPVTGPLFSLNVGPLPNPSPQSIQTSNIVPSTSLPPNIAPSSSPQLGSRTLPASSPAYSPRTNPKHNSPNKSPIIMERRIPSLGESVNLFLLFVSLETFRPVKLPPIGMTHHMDKIRLIPENTPFCHALLSPFLEN